MKKNDLFGLLPPQKIVLFRNPKDLCVSYFHFYRSSSSFGNFQGDWPEFLEMFLDGHGIIWVFFLYILIEVLKKIHEFPACVYI